MQKLQSIQTTQVLSILISSVVHLWLTSDEILQVGSIARLNFHFPMKKQSAAFSQSTLVE